jgi:hypothetical protein
MTANAATILAHLSAVALERTSRHADAALERRVTVLKAYQQQRFACTHKGVLAHERFGPAGRFFLDDLYGPSDFTDRDAQFARIVPGLVRIFPQEIIETVDLLAELHALSEQLDSQMARTLPDPPWERADYIRAWQAVGQPQARARQLELALMLGRQLDGYTRSRWLRQTLRMMRAPARAAGLAALQTFLERGFDTFAGMRGAAPFLDQVQQHEQALMNRLFDPGAVAVATAPGLSPDDPIGQLP